MTTTIQINEETLNMLKSIKDQIKARSYDEAIKKIIKGPKKSMYGYLGKKNKAYILKDLRDKYDRF